MERFGVLNPSSGRAFIDILKVEQRAGTASSYEGSRDDP
jgi:hypothetical protein